MNGYFDDEKCARLSPYLFTPINFGFNNNNNNN